MTTPFQRQVTQAENTKRSAEGARAEAQQARAGISTPSADRLISQGDQQLAAGNTLLTRGHPAEATGQYAAANASFNQATADAERERAALAQQAAAAQAARQAAAAAAQQAAIARQREQAAAQQAAARTAAQKAAAAAAVQAALNAKAAAAARNTAAIHTIAAQPQAPRPSPAPAGPPVQQKPSSRPAPAPAHKVKGKGATVVFHPVKPPKAIPVKVKHPVAVATGAYTSMQIEQQDIMYRAWEQSHSSWTVARALFLIGVAENEWDPYTCNSSDHCGVFQLDSGWQRMHSFQDTAYWAGYAIKNGFYSYGGLAHIAAVHPDWEIGEIVQACQGAGPTFAAAAAYYQGRLPESDAALRATQARLGGTSSGGRVPSRGAGSFGPVPIVNPSPHSGSWNGTLEGVQLQAAYDNLHGTISRWNPGFRHQLQLAARRPIGG